MAELQYQNPSVKGAVINFTAAAEAGDSVAFREGGIILVNNGSEAEVDVTVVTPGNDKYGNARPDIVKAVAAGAICAFGPLDKDLVDKADGLIDITYEAHENVTVAAIV
jgi:hypothetical protein